MKKLLIIAITGLISVTASASNWVLVFSHPTANLYVDTDSISNSGRYKSAFSFGKYIEPQRIGNQTYNYVNSYIQYDCRSNPIKYRFKSSIAKNGNQIVHQTNRTQINWNIVYPDTANESVAKFICSY